MGLDVYVGSITRYLCGDWETVVQKYARESGLQVRVVRQNDPADAITDPLEVLPVVLRWRQLLSGGLQGSGGPSLDWDERAEAPYFTDKPGWDANGDLLLWAAYSEKSLRPPAASVADWSDDPVFVAAANGATRYPALLRGAEVWLPGDFPHIFRGKWVTGDELMYSSAPQLARELEDLNSRTFRSSLPEIIEWRREGKESTEPLEKGARFALAVFSELAREAVEHRLVMKLDY